MKVSYKAGPWTIYTDETASRESPIGLVSVVIGRDSLFEVRYQSGVPLIRARDSQLAQTYGHLDLAIQAADRAIAAEVARQNPTEELTLEEMTELIRQLRLRLLHDSDVHVGGFAEQHFMLGLASLDQAERHLTLATAHHRIERGEALAEYELKRKRDK